MKKYLLLSFLLFAAYFSNAQRLLSWTPEFPQDNSTVAITGDCNKGNKGLLNYEGGSSANVYVHVGVITNLSTSPTDWKYTKFTWGTADPAAHATPLGSNKYLYTITNPRTFFGVPAGETILKITCIFRNATGTLKNVNSDGSDMYIPVYAAGQYAVRLNLPPTEPRFIPWLEPITGTSVPVQGVSTSSSSLSLSYNTVPFASASSATTVSGTAVINSSCAQSIVINGTSGASSATDSANFYIAPATTTAALPSGAIEGINYNPNNTSVTLVLYAPSKNHVVVIGDFSNWASQCSNQMNRTPDGNYYWLTLNDLTPGQEYGYQYVVDDTIKIADPYSQKILDPNNDQYISAVTYPNLKPYPTGLTTDLVSVFQPAEPQYNWQVTNFTKPDKRNLVIYELLVRDFTAQHSYQALIDSIQYLKNIGINAIELMPVNEFDGNESWGYNPDFYFAPDKYYGTKNKLKEFIDLCHQNNIAVLLDVVYNHCTGNAPEAKLYWNSATSAPAANNPWLNVSAPHPYSVYNDFNHTSTATQYLVERSLNFWIDEYKVDGYRFDLAKGFTQTVSNTTTVENFDPSRVQNIERYYDNVVPSHPNTYMILEFLGTLPCAEEQEYASHGMMLWGNANGPATQCTMGYTANSDLSLLSYNSSQRNYNNPASVGYMESHDEERTMYKNLNFGNSSGGYNVTNLPTALAREEAAASIFFMVPGPKMIWQFEERGYDISLVYGGSNTADKPPHWEYMDDVNRRHLYNTYTSIINLRLNNPNVFNNTTFSYDLYNSAGLYKSFQIADPAATGAKVTAIANLDVTAKAKSITFQTTGTWTSYISNGTGSSVNGATGTNFTITAANQTQTITLQPGEYHIYYFAASCTTTVPTVTSPVTYCQGSTATALTATGTNLLWYTTATGGTGSSTAPVPSTTTVGSTIYYVSQTANSCEGPRAAITVVINATPAAPTVTSPVAYCQGVTTTALTASGSNLLWYTTATGGIGSSTAPTPSATTVGSVNYYVSQTTGTCEGPRAVITVTVTALPAAPIVTTPVTYCQGAAATALTATGTNIRWYTTATGGIGSSIAPTPSTTTTGSTVYYVTQTPGSCESPRASIVVTINPNTAILLTSPASTTSQNVCINTPITNITYITANGATGVTVAGLPAGVTGTYSGGTNGTFTISGTPTVSGPFNYTVITSGGCGSPSLSGTITVIGAPNAPTVTSPVTYCQGATASPLTATGSNLLWYTTATGGTGSATAPTPSTTAAGSTTYYVSQTGSCGPGAGESPRAAIVVNVNALPAAPTVTSPLAYCQNATATALTATGSNLLWYTTATGGTGSATAPTPSTTTAGSVTYYVSQTVSTCEGPRAAIMVNVTATPAAPTVSSPVTYCQNAAAVALTATGTNLLWYTVSSGGTGSSTAPTPATTTIGSINYYVSQTTGSCEGPRATITVNVTATTPAPVVTSPIAYCQGATATPLTATGSNLLWYTAATGGTGSSTAPTPSTTAAGSTTYYVSQTQTCGESPRAAIVVNVNALPAAPTVVSPVAYCQNTTAVPLTATGTNLLWYTTATGGTGSATAPTPSTTASGSTTYYVSQTASSCEGPRAAIVVNVTATPAAPTVTSPVTYCQNTTAVPLTATGTNLLWYTTATGGTGSATAPTPLTTTVGLTNYYVSQSTNSCEGPRALIAVNIVASTPAPTVTSPVAYCQGATAVPLTATGTNLLWYTSATGGTGSATAPTPSTTAGGSTTYYVSQTLSCGESPRAAIVVNVTATPSAPTVSSPVAYCQNSTAVPLSATGTNLLWYTTATGGTGSATAPTPSTTAGGSTTYYVSQTTTSCEGPRAAIVVNVTATPAAPTVTSPVTYCQNTTTVPLTATGTNLLWYTTATGGTGSATAPTPITTTAGSTNYYVSQSTNTCEGPRALITVNIVASTPAPTVTSPVAYCQNATAVPLTATGTALLWYTVATGGAGSSTAPTPSTTVVGSTTYYVSQTLSCGEGPRAAIVVNINPIPAAPTVSSPVAYCQNTTAVPLTATGSNLLWYTTATGGSGSATAPTPSTTTGGSTTYYVSQTTTSCEGPRAAIVVNVTATPAAPTVTSPVTYCQNTTAVPLTATGTNLLWYPTATGGTGSSTAPTPPTTTAGSTNYYVSQSTNTCESPRALITVNITASTPAPTVTSPVAYCQNTTAVPLTATGTGLLWYTTATGGVGSSTAPTPSTTVVGSTTYYVSQTLSCGEGPRAAIVVNINPIPGAPTVSSPVAYCQNTTAVPLTATGSNLLWYTTATGGTGSATAPTPSTTTGGSTTYYVSQTTTSCEGPRAAIVVNVTATPAAPTVTSPVTYCQNTTAVPLTATGTNLLWYTTATGGTGSVTAPTPSTTTAGSTNYYVSQSTNTCEGPRATITVNITASTPAPTVTTPVVYCQGTTAVPLTATGTALLWYTAATGGTGSSAAPTPSTATAGNTIYYVSQTLTCGEGPRAAITVTVNPTPGAPTVTSPVLYCQNSTAVALTATGTNLLWYTTATGGTGSAAAPVPVTTTVGSTIYYVSQTTGTCQGPRAAITVTVNITPGAPTVTTPVAYCRTATATPLTATGINLLWYNAATGGTGSAAAPTPSTAAVGTTIYYVSQTTGTCEGPRAAITVNVTDVPAAPVVTTTPFVYCQNTVATQLTATGTNLLWYTTATGGTGSATAPVPSTATAGTIIYYVSQGNGCGESVRSAITVTTTPAPPAPTNLTASAISTTSAILNWTGTTGVFYTVEYKVSTATTWTTAVTGLTATTYTLTGLTMGTSYNWRVNANCAATAGAIFSTTDFTTSSRNNSIPNIVDGIGIKLSPVPVSTSSTEILDYIVPANGQVSIVIIDALGQKVKTLVNAVQAAGQYQIDITSMMTGMRSGTYFIKLRQGNKSTQAGFVHM